MPSGNVWNNQWLGRNSLRAYPLAESSTRVDTSGDFRLPDSFLVDMNIPVSTSLSVLPGRFFLMTLTAMPAGVQITIGYDNGTDPAIAVAKTAFGRAAHLEDNTYTLTGLGDFADTQGYVTVGRLDDLDDQPSGKFTFTYAGGKLEPGVIRPNIRGVTSFILVNGEDESDPITGDVRLVAGSNTRLSLNDDNEIVWDAIEGEGLNQSCDCLGADSLPECIRSINNVTGDDQGNLTLIGKTCIEFTAVTNGLSVQDTCAFPCCGCDKLEKLTNDLSGMLDGASSLRSLIDRIGGQVTQLSLTVLGSRIGDGNTCQECCE